MYAHVSREEWLFRCLAIATILALVGMAVLPAVNMIDYLTFMNGSSLILFILKISVKLFLPYIF